MLIISAQRGNGFIHGFIDAGDYYARFDSSPNGFNIDDENKILKSEYRDYEHFAAIMGKFDPYTFFLEHPIEISSLDYETLISTLRLPNISI
jgi:hypothetical protein